MVRKASQAGYVGLARTALWPALTNRRAVVVTASRFASSSRTPSAGLRSETAIRSRDGGSSLLGDCPAITANPTAASATVVARMPCWSARTSRRR